MKKTKLITLLSTIALASAGAFAFVGSKKVEETKAASDEVWSLIGVPDWSTDTDLSYNSELKFYGSSSKGRYELNCAFTGGDKFKVRKDHSWDKSIGYGGQTGQGISTYLKNDGTGNFEVKETGKYVISVKDDNVAGYVDKSYGFAIAKVYGGSIYDGSEVIKTYYYEDYNNTGYAYNFEASDFAKDGYEFLGLFTDSEFNEEFKSGDKAHNRLDYNLYAKYEVEPQKYSVTYDVNGSEDTAPTQSSVAEGVKFNVAAAVSKDGYHFAGWSDGTNTYQPNDEYTMGSSNVTLTAQWTPFEHSNGYYIKNFTTNALSAMTFDSVKNEWSTEVTVAVDDIFKVIKYENDTIATYHGFKDLDWGDGSARDEAQIIDDNTNDHNMKAAVAGTYTVYYRKGGQERPIWISAIEIIHTFELEVTHNEVPTKYTLVENEGTEMKTESEVTVYAGDTLAFYIDDALQTVNPKYIGNNNCTSVAGVTTIQFDMTAKIYVDFYEGTVFCGGMEYGEFGLIVNGQYVRMTHNENPVDPSFTEWYKQGYEFAENAEISFVDTTHNDDVAIQFAITTINEHSCEGFEVSGGYIKCTAEGGKTTDIYVKFKSGADEVYFGDVSEDDAAAQAFAKEFNTTIMGVCDDAGVNTNKENLSLEWSSLASKFDELIEAAQAKLTNASDKSGNDDVKAFAAKYNYVYSKYGEELHLDNFAARTIVSNARFNLTPVSNANTTWIIVVVSLASVSLLGGLLFVKRRKALNK